MPRHWAGGHRCSSDMQLWLGDLRQSTRLSMTVVAEVNGQDLNSYAS